MCLLKKKYYKGQSFQNSHRRCLGDLWYQQKRGKNISIKSKKMKYYIVILLRLAHEGKFYKLHRHQTPTQHSHEPTYFSYFSQNLAWFTRGNDTKPWQTLWSWIDTYTALQSRLNFLIMKHMYQPWLHSSLGFYVLFGYSTWQN